MERSQEGHRPTRTPQFQREQCLCLLSRIKTAARKPLQLLKQSQLVKSQQK